MDMEEDRPGALLLGNRAALASIFGFWAFYYATVTLRSIVLDFDNQLEMLGRRAIVTLASMAATWLIYRVLRRHAAQSLRAGVIAAALLSAPAAIFYATVNHYAFAGALAATADPPPETKHVMIDERGGVIVCKDGKTVMIAPPEPPEAPMPGESVSIQVGDDWDRWEGEEKSPAMLIADQAVNGYFFFAAWCALFLAMANAAAVAAAERRAARFRAAAQAAELRALRYQVNPHFLFNTLNSLSSLVMGGRREAAERMIMNLATFFRTSLTGDPTEDVPLYEEIRLQRLYLDIEAVRFPDRMIVDIALPDDLRTACVPGLILQPIVENAVKYGVSRARRPVTLRIRARQDTRGLVLTVEDDGDAPASVEDAGIGVGLRNVRDRLAARFGDAARCDWGVLPEGGFAVTLVMPVTRHGC